MIRKETKSNCTHDLRVTKGRALLFVWDEVAKTDKNLVFTLENTASNIERLVQSVLSVICHSFFYFLLL